MSILAIDVGNTRTKFVVCSGESQSLPHCREFLAVSNTDYAGLVTQLQRLAQSTANAALAGSNKTLLGSLLGAWPDDIARPVVVESWTQLQLTLDLTSPETVGVDRLLNAVGVKAVWPGGVTVIVDAGTATTVDLVVDGVFKGGAILPGLELSARSLKDHTDVLPLIDTRNLTVETVTVPGRSTPEAIEAGVFLGQVGAVRELTLASTAALTDKPRIVFTGGAAKQLAGAFAEAIVMPHLALRALATVGASD